MSEITMPIAVWHHDAIQGDVIDSAGLPINPDILSNAVPGVVTESFREGLGATALHAVSISRLSSAHGRSYEVGYNQIKPLALWQDRQGNQYSSLSLKGNNFTRTAITASLTAPSGYLPYGLQEDDALLRVVRASSVLRDAKIPTEWIVGVYEPQHIPHNETGQLVSQHDYKKKLIEHALLHYNPEEAAKVANAIAPMTFFITARAMEIDHRPYDFAHDTTIEEVKARLAKVFTIYNRTHLNDENFSPLDVSNTQDIMDYFGIILPKLRAKHLAQLHKIGLIHKFPVYHNTTALGGIIDLDSMHGEPLGVGDKPITSNDILRDLMMAHDAEHADEGMVLVHLSELGDDFKDIFKLNFTAPFEYGKEYIQTAAIDPDSIEALHIWGAILAGKLMINPTHLRVYPKIIEEMHRLMVLHVPEQTFTEWQTSLAAYGIKRFDEYLEGLPESYVRQRIDEGIVKVLHEITDSNSKEHVMEKVVGGILGNIASPILTSDSGLSYKVLRKNSADTLQSIRKHLLFSDSPLPSSINRMVSLAVADKAHEVMLKACINRLQDWTDNEGKTIMTSVIRRFTQPRSRLLELGESTMVTVNRGRLTSHNHYVKWEDLKAASSEKNIAVEFSNFDYDQDNNPNTQLPVNVLEIFSDGPDDDTVILSGIDNGVYTLHAGIGDKTTYLAFLVDETESDTMKDKRYKLVVHDFKH